MTETRTSIREHVHANAGVHFNELVRAEAFAPGQVQYHLRRLIDEGAVVREEFYGQTHYYPPSTTDWERAALALFRRESSRAIVSTLLEREATTPATLARDLDLARSTVEYHLDRLVEREVVEKRYDHRNRVSLTLTNPTRTRRLLQAVEPSTPDRLVDRFTRFVDDVFEDATE
ncbi:winged helix-turn-helix transcriptional regulator [Halovivax gelatinilyticus]|uniref:winged helix-turn-helix transcriptional regulator n=1 Tax=Halovivax gelatinilyticus TaxID=2961597 RepID=UPI0020CA8722|nr:winged helix-turn-helix transcriptional regulator [Halovivax gelatinilyticus]